MLESNGYELMTLSSIKLTTPQVNCDHVIVVRYNFNTDVASFWEEGIVRFLNCIILTLKNVNDIIFAILLLRLPLSSEGDLTVIGPPVLNSSYNRALFNHFSSREK